MSQRLAAIDFSAKGARIITATGSLRSTELTSAMSFDYDPDEETWEEFVARLYTALPVGTDSVVVGADSRKMSVRSLEFPFSELRKLDAAIEFELETLIPFSIEEITTSWEVTHKEGQRTRVLAAVIPREMLESRLASFETVGLQVRAFMSPASSLGELILDGHPEVKAARNPTGVLALGDNESHFAIMKEGRILFSRTFRAGGHQMDRMVARSMNVDLPAARREKEERGRLLDAEVMEGDDAALSEALKSGLKPLLSSLAMTFRSLPQECLPSRLLVTGGLSNLSGLGGYLESELQLPVASVELSGTVEHVNTGDITFGPEYAPALGMLLGLIRRGSNIPLNFRQKEYAYQGDLDLYRGQLKHIAIGLSIVILLALGGGIMKYWMLTQDEARINQGFCDATQKIVGREICNPTAAVATLKEAPGAGEGFHIPRYSSGRIYEALSKIITKEVDVEFQELDFRLGTAGGELDRVIGKGEAGSFEATEELVRLLKGDPCVKEAEVSKQRKTRNTGRVEFSLKVRLSCPVGIMPGETVAGNIKPALEKPEGGRDHE